MLVLASSSPTSSGSRSDRHCNRLSLSGPNTWDGPGRPCQVPGTPEASPLCAAVAPNGTRCVPECADHPHTHTPTHPASQRIPHVPTVPAAPCVCVCVGKAGLFSSFFLLQVCRSNCSGGTSSEQWWMRPDWEDRHSQRSESCRGQVPGAVKTRYQHGRMARDGSQSVQSAPETSLFVAPLG